MIRGKRKTRRRTIQEVGIIDNVADIVTSTISIREPVTLVRSNHAIKIELIPNVVGRTITLIVETPRATVLCDKRRVYFKTVFAEEPDINIIGGNERKDILSVLVGIS